MRLLLALLPLFITEASAQAPLDGFHPPATPLIVMDPFINTWSLYEELFVDWVAYWDGQPKEFNGMIRVDGQTYTFMGLNNVSRLPPDTVTQNSVKVWPTRTIYEMQDPKGRVHLTVQFTTPLLPEEWEVSTRPITYVTFGVTSTDAANHRVQLYFDLEADIAVNMDMSVEVQWSHFQVHDEAEAIDVMQIGTVSQNYFDDPGIFNGIDWGYAYVAVPKEDSVSAVIGEMIPIRKQFVNNGTIPTTDDEDMPKPVQDHWDALVATWDLNLEAGATETKHLVVAYDDIYSIQYFGQKFQSYWRRPEANATIETLLQKALEEYDDTMQACQQFDTALVQELQLKGGDQYATLAALAYRQTRGATKLVWNNAVQKPWAFLSSIDTDGNLNTMDTIASTASLFLYTDPAYLQALLQPILAYANNDTGNTTYDYPYPWAPNSLSDYPKADITPSMQKNMPMEDTGNLFILLAALQRTLGGNFTDEWYPKYWPLLKSWADYMVTTLPDPGTQMTTDNQVDPPPHDANLAIKGIVGLGAFAQLCSAVEMDDDAKYYEDLAESFVEQWIVLAKEGDHYKMAYDQNNTWSLKYNLFYDKLLELGLFPQEVYDQEIDYYFKYHLCTFGIPLDSQGIITKVNRMSYIAAMAKDDQKEQLLSAIYNWVTSDHPFYPFPNDFGAVDGTQSNFYGNPVVGALYSLMIV